MLMGPFAARREIDAYAVQMKKAPGNYIAQPLIELSAHPTWVDGTFEPRRIDLRPFILYGESIRVLPGGLTRVALRPGSYVVNSSRVADSLYWMGRYLERSENITRLLLVTEDFSSETQGLAEQLAQSAWKDLLAILPSAQVGPPSSAFAPMSQAYLQGFFLDPGNHYSVHYSLRRARDNARSVREALTVEVFLALNETFRAVESHARRGLALPQAGRVAGAHLPDGPDPARQAAGAGRDRAARGRRPLLHAMADAAAGARLARELSPLVRRPAGAGAGGAFLLFDPHSPRSLSYGTEAVKRYLERIAGGGEAVGGAPPG